MNGNGSMDDDVISVGRPLLRIAAVEALEARQVRIKWQSGKSDVLDLTPALASHRAFIKLRDDDALFHTIHVNEDGNALEWDNGLELSAEWIERLPIPAMPNSEFRKAMDELSMSLDGMAAMLGTSRRLIADYRKDKPIPRHISLATRYLLDREAAPR